MVLYCNFSYVVIFLSLIKWFQNFYLYKHQTAAILKCQSEFRSFTLRFRRLTAQLTSKKVPRFLPVWWKISPIFPLIGDVASSRMMCYDVPRQALETEKTLILSTKWVSEKVTSAPPFTFFSEVPSWWSGLFLFLDLGRKLSTKSQIQRQYFRDRESPSATLCGVFRNELGIVLCGGQDAVLTVRESFGNETHVLPSWRFGALRHKNRDAVLNLDLSTTVRKMHQKNIKQLTRVRQGKIRPIFHSAA